MTLYYSRDVTKLDAERDRMEQIALEKENTPEKISERIKKREDEKTKLKSLNPRFYYNAKYEPFTIKLTYLSDPRSLESYATKIGSVLMSLGFDVAITPVSGKDFSASLQK